MNQAWHILPTPKVWSPDERSKFSNFTEQLNGSSENTTRLASQLNGNHHLTSQFNSQHSGLNGQHSGLIAACNKAHQAE